MTAWQRIGIVVPTPQELAYLLTDLAAGPGETMARIWPRWQAQVGQTQVSLTTVSAIGRDRRAAVARCPERAGRGWAT